MNGDPRERAYQEAFDLARQGRWPLAESACLRLLEAQPNRADALCLLGVIRQQTGRTDEAIDAFRRSLVLESRQPLAHSMLGDALLDRGRTSEALQSYDEALRQHEGLQPALVGRANALLDMQQWEAARGAFDRVLERDANHPEAWFNRGNALLAIGQPRLALDSFERALNVRPDYAAALNNRGAALSQLEQFEAALASFEAAIAAAPALADAHRNRSRTLVTLGRFAEALQASEQALKLNPEDVEAQYGRGNVLLSLGRTEDALACLSQVLTRAPEHRAALKLQGDALTGLHRYEAAAQSIARLLRLDPESEYAADALHHAMRWCADWSYADTAADPNRLREAVLAGRRVDHPFSFLAVTDDPEAQQRCARTLIEAQASHGLDLRRPTPYAHERLRVAYVSGDFREHAVSYLLAGVLEQHDAERFDTIGISLRHPVDSALGRQMQAAVGRFVEVSELNDHAVAQLIRSLEVDIVVDLAGHTSRRFNLFSYRPAPIQVQYLGFPGTLGAPYIDYLLADAFVVPPGEARHYTEKIVYLPECYQANGTLRRRDLPKPARREFGFAPETFVFCCFNNVYKLNSTVFEVWMRILQRVPRAVLWLYAPTEIAAHNLRQAASRAGIDPRRLVFATRLPYQAHVTRLAIADLFLDTLPFNGGATASDALWAGVPVLTCCGRSFAARMAGSLLHTAGLPELITTDWAAYEEKAVELAQDSMALAAIRSRLEESCASSSLFDGTRFCRWLERAYTQMWDNYRRGHPPASFTVGRDSGSLRSSHLSEALRQMKKKYTWVVMSNCDPAHEPEFNDWYDNVHIRDLLRIPGVTGATRAVISPSQMSKARGTKAVGDSNGGKYKYLAFYTLETDDVEGFFEAIRRRSGTPEMSISPYLIDAHTVMYEGIDRGI